MMHVKGGFNDKAGPSLLVPNRTEPSSHLRTYIVSRTLGISIIIEPSN